MGVTTKLGLPWPAGTDPVAQGDDAIRSLAETLDGLIDKRGKSIIPTEEAHTSGTTYGLMPTPDRVSGFVVAANAIVRIGFQAMWKESVDGAARAAIFIGANQVKIGQLNVAAPVVQEARCYAGAGLYSPLVSATHGLMGGGAATATAYTGDVTTGQVLGAGVTGSPIDEPYSALGTHGYGFCELFVAAGTYDIAIQVKATSGTVTVKERKLWVEVGGY